MTRQFAPSFAAGALALAGSLLLGACATGPGVPTASASASDSAITTDTGAPSPATSGDMVVPSDSSEPAASNTAAAGSADGDVLPGDVSFPGAEQLAGQTCLATFTALNACKAYVINASGSRFFYYKYAGSQTLIPFTQTTFGQGWLEQLQRRYADAALAAITARTHNWPLASQITVRIPRITVHSATINSDGSATLITSENWVVVRADGTTQFVDDGKHVHTITMRKRAGRILSMLQFWVVYAIN